MTTYTAIASGSTPALYATSTASGGAGTNTPAISAFADSDRNAVNALSGSINGYPTVIGYNNATGTLGTMFGVYGRADGGTTSTTYGVYGYAPSGGYGVFGNGPIAVQGSGTSIGVVANASLSGGIGLQALASGTGSKAGDFHGAVAIAGAVTITSGSLTVNGTNYKSWRIDHPLDPENKFLLHACLESPEAKNLYDGTQLADENGELTVQLPDWFEKVNTNLRYQLTAMGAPAPQLHVKQGVRNGKFIIAGAASGQTVCWQVTGTRNDPAAVLNPFVAEQDKATHERGLFICPEGHGQPKEKGMDFGRMAEAATRAKAGADTPQPTMKTP